MPPGRGAGRRTRTGLRMLAPALTLLAVLVVLAGCTTDDGGRGAASGEARADVPSDTVEVEILWITDGDTVGVRPAEDHRVLRSGRDTTVRLLEIDAPERGRGGRPADCYYDEATDRLAGLLPEGSRAWAQLDRDPVDPYDRVLAYLWNDDGVFVNRALVEEGYAEVVLFEPNDRHIATMRDAERTAREGDRGLWGACR